MISIIIPARNEQYLKKTVLDLLEKAQGVVEIVVVLDGYWPVVDDIVDDKRVRYVHHGEIVGMRKCINAGIAIARYDYILKCDAHCMFDHGFDVKLLLSVQKNWCVVPTEKRLDPVTWAITDGHKADVDYMIIGDDLKGRRDDKKNRDERLKAKKIDDLMTFQGSCYFVNKQHFLSLGLLNTDRYDGSGHEAQEIGFAYWFSGGRVVVNKNTWYAHWQRKKSKRGYKSGDSQKSRDAMKRYIKKHQYQYKNLINRFKEEATETKAPVKMENFKRRDLVKLLAKNGLKNGAEIGVRSGKFSEIMCQLIPDAKMLSVDPYTVVYKDYRSKAMGADKQELYFKEATDRLSKYDCTIIRKESLDAVKDIPYESLDFVYIDASHEFDYVMTDLIEWSKRVRPGGIVAGHDYYYFHGGAVVLAVDTYIRAHKIKEWFLTSDRTPSFWWVKP